MRVIDVIVGAKILINSNDVNRDSIQPGFDSKNISLRWGALFLSRRGGAT